MVPNYLTCHAQLGPCRVGESQRISLGNPNRFQPLWCPLYLLIYLVNRPITSDNDRLIASLKKMRDLGNTDRRRTMTTYS